MTDKIRPLDISNEDQVRRLVEEVQANDEACALQIDQKVVAILVPVSRARTSSRRGKATSAADPLWNIVGIGDTEGQGDVAENIDRYLAEALLPSEG